VGDAREPEELTETVDDAIARVLLELPGVDRRDDPSGREASVGGRAFAYVGTGTLEVLLDPAVAAAALRTPDVTASPRGRGWVAFSPPPGSTSRLDVDRARAWLVLAHRRVAAPN